VTTDASFTLPRTDHTWFKIDNGTLSYASDRLGPWYQIGTFDMQTYDSVIVGSIGGGAFWINSIQ